MRLPYALIRHGPPLLVVLIILAWNGVDGVPMPDGDPDMPQEGFFRNPHEAEEGIERVEAYRDFYEKHLSDDLDGREILKGIFAPRIYEDLFDTDLPTRQSRGQLSLRLAPKFSDFLREDFVRFRIGITYDFSSWFDAFSDIGTYFGNPFDDGDGSGLYSWRFGAKYSWIGVGGSDFNVAFGIRAETPLSNPPPELTDRYARYSPYLTVSHQLKQHPRWVLYLNMAFEFVNETPFRSDLISPQPRDRQFLRPGAIYYPGGHFRYSFELEYRTNALDFRDDHSPVTEIPEPIPPDSRYANWVLAAGEVHELIARPAVTWFPTRKIREGLIIPGNWDLGIEFDLPIFEETGEDFGISVRFRWYYDYRAFITRDLRRLFTPKNP